MQARALNRRVPRAPAAIAPGKPPSARRADARRAVSLLFAVVVVCACAGGRAHAAGSATRLLPLPSPRRGLSFDLYWDADAYANLDGGYRRGYATDSVLSAGVGLDTGALGAWRGGKFRLGLQAITSTHPSTYAGDLQTLSNLDAPTRRQIATLWYSQQLGTSLLRAGIIDMNAYFDVNDAAGLFPNSSFGIIPSISVDVPASIYPDYGWGVMGRLGTDTDNWLVGVFQGDPRNRASALQDGAMLIAERDWRNLAAGSHIGIGAWYRQVPADAQPPASDWGAYANVEHPWPHHPDTVAFLQLGTSPGKVNSVPAYLGAGIRIDDVSERVSQLGFGLARAWIRGHAAETSIEATALLPFDGSTFDLQPDLQYIVHPSGLYPNALVVGLRIHVTLY